MISLVLAALVWVGALAAAVDAGYFYRGRHRGKYVEDPAWKRGIWTVQPDGSLIFNGRVHIATGDRQKAGNLWVEVKPDLADVEDRRLRPGDGFYGGQVRSGYLRDLKEERWHDLGTIATDG